MLLRPTSCESGTWSWRRLGCDSGWLRSRPSWPMSWERSCKLQSSLALRSCPLHSRMIPICITVVKFINKSINGDDQRPYVHGRVKDSSTRYVQRLDKRSAHPPDIGIEHENINILPVRGMCWHWIHLQYSLVRVRHHVCIAVRLH